jgi:hypothetical protein
MEVCKRTRGAPAALTAPLIATVIPNTTASRFNQGRKSPLFRIENIVDIFERKVGLL